MDTLEGKGGNDVLLAGPGNDEIFAGSGNDDITAGEEYDRVHGMLGDDRLYFADGVTDGVITCGSGFDKAFVDQKDLSNTDVDSCEDLRVVN